MKWWGVQHRCLVCKRVIPLWLNGPKGAIIPGSLWNGHEWPDGPDQDRGGKAPKGEEEGFGLANMGTLSGL